MPQVKSMNSAAWGEFFTLVDRIVNQEIPETTHQKLTSIDSVPVELRRKQSLRDAIEAVSRHTHSAGVQNNLEELCSMIESIMD